VPPPILPPMGLNARVTTFQPSMNTKVPIY
jgi:hypothetical protein